MNNLEFTNDVSTCVLDIENVTIHIMFGDSVVKNVTEKMTRDSLHFHPYAELFVCCKGSLQLKREDQSIIELFDGDAYLLPPYLKHNKYNSSDNCIWYATDFSCTPKYDCYEHDVYSLFKDFFKSTQAILIRNHPELTTNVANIMAQLTQKPLWLSAQNLALQLINLAYEYMSPLKASYNLHSPSQTGIDDHIIRQSILDNIINTRYKDSISVSDVAKIMNLSERQLARYVKKYYGTTLRRAIISKRIDIARQLLLSNDMSIEQISQTVGFSSAPSFCREFQREFAISPSKFRQLHR